MLGNLLQKLAAGRGAAPMPMSPVPNAPPPLMAGAGAAPAIPPSINGGLQQMLSQLAQSKPQMPPVAQAMHQMQKPSNFQSILRGLSIKRKVSGRSNGGAAAKTEATTQLPNNQNMS